MAQDWEETTQANVGSAGDFAIKLNGLAAKTLPNSLTSTTDSITAGLNQVRPNTSTTEFTLTSGKTHVQLVLGINASEDQPITISLDSCTVLGSSADVLLTGNSGSEYWLAVDPNDSTNYLIDGINQNATYSRSDASSSSGGITSVTSIEGYDVINTALLSRTYTNVTFTSISTGNTSAIGTVVLNGSGTPTFTVTTAGSNYSVGEYIEVNLEYDSNFENTFGLIEGIS